MALKTKNPKAEKSAIIESLTNDVKSASSFIFTEYRGLTVEQITALRNKLREESCSYKVIRNNFARIAFDSASMPDAKTYLIGPTALAVVNGNDANIAAKTLFDYAKEVPALVVKGAIVNGEFYDAAKIEAFSKLPGKKELISMFMSTLNATTSKFVRTLQAIVDKGDASANTDVKTEAANEAASEV